VLSGTGEGVRGVWLRSSSYSEPVVPSVPVLEVDDDNEGGAASDSELLGDAKTRVGGFTDFCFEFGRATLLLFQPSRVT
jgi:hypothetical protein